MATKLSMRSLLLPIPRKVMYATCNRSEEYAHMFRCDEKALTEDIKNFKERYGEKPMSSEYKRGVEDATKYFSPEELSKAITQSVRVDNISADYFEAAKQAQDNRRKSLLTKKVTKWANVYDDNNAFLYDTKEEAGKSRGASCLGSFPIEIEVPID